MSEVLKPIKSEEYITYYRELYAPADDGSVLPKFRVAIDRDPSKNPKAINEKLAEIQGLKDRLVVILNCAIKNEQYWKSVVKRIEDRFDSEYKKALLLPDVKKGGNTEARVSLATDLAKQAILTNSFNGEGTYDARMSEIGKRHSEAIAFLSEVKNLYDNLDSSNMVLAVQLKSVMMNARIYGGAWVEEDAHGKPS
jgi:hypothetical protein